MHFRAEGNKGINKDQQEKITVKWRQITLNENENQKLELVNHAFWLIRFNAVYFLTILPLIWTDHFRIALYFFKTRYNIWTLVFLKVNRLCYVNFTGNECDTASLLHLNRRNKAACHAFNSNKNGISTDQWNKIRCNPFYGGSRSHQRCSCWCDLLASGFDPDKKNALWTKFPNFADFLGLKSPFRSRKLKLRLYPAGLSERVCTSSKHLQVKSSAFS